MKLQEAKECQESLLNKAWVDEQFKTELINNPRKTISKHFNDKVEFPKDSKIVVEDQSSDRFVYLNIPRKIDFENLVLSDDDLELVAGGGTPALGILTTAGCLVAMGACLIGGIIWGAMK